ncbi:MAG: glycosyltransferase [Verrucomicrobiales bacterium]|nr:glycosyltransferase [Verrucomicrobiales bacterium]
MIFYDITELYRFNKCSGIQKVTSEFLKFGLSNLGDQFVVCFLKDGQLFTVTVIVSPEGDIEGFEEIKAAPFPSAGDLYLMVDLCYNHGETEWGVIDSYKNHGVTVVAVLYDLIPVRHPEWFQGDAIGWFEEGDYLARFNLWLSYVRRYCDAIGCISEYVQEDFRSLADSFPDPCPNTFSFLLGSSTYGLKRKNEFDSNDFISVGTVEPRKGYSLLIDAFERLWRDGDDVRLVIVGKKGWLVDALCERIQMHREYGKRLLWLADASDDELLARYRRASGFISLSENEGFGLPVIEAAALGLPVILRDTPIYREVGVGFAAYVQDVAAVVERVREIQRGDLKGCNSSENIRSWEYCADRFYSKLSKL